MSSAARWKAALAHRFRSAAALSARCSTNPPRPAAPLHTRHSAALTAALFTTASLSQPAFTRTAPLPRTRASAAHGAAGFATSTSTSKMGAPTSGAAGVMEVVRVPCLSDNYVWLLHEVAPAGGGAGRTAVVDPAEEGPVVEALAARGWTLDAVLNTHHHADHTGANLALKRRFPGLMVVGPRADKDRIPAIDVQVGCGDTWHLGGLEVRVFDTPGHTRGHITYYVPQAASLFPGDTLFALGCGRLFEGSPQQMWASLSKLTPLPDDTLVYCAHEYTQSNARFAVTVDPRNAALAQRKAAIDAARAQRSFVMTGISHSPSPVSSPTAAAAAGAAAAAAAAAVRTHQGEPTVPSRLGEEKATNPFLRPHDPAIRQQLGFDAAAPDWQVFGAIRAAKDRF